jgi:hypothetical protein
VIVVAGGWLALRALVEVHLLVNLAGVTAPPQFEQGSWPEDCLVHLFLLLDPLPAGFGNLLPCGTTLDTLSQQELRARGKRFCA